THRPMTRRHEHRTLLVLIAPPPPQIGRHAPHLEHRSWPGRSRAPHRAHTSSEQLEMRPAVTGDGEGEHPRWGIDTSRVAEPVTSTVQRGTPEVGAPADHLHPRMVVVAGDENVRVTDRLLSCHLPPPPTVDLRFRVTGPEPGLVAVRQPDDQPVMLKRQGQIVVGDRE